MHYLAVVTAELADDAARGDVPIEDLSVGAAGHQFRVIPAQKQALKPMNSKKTLGEFSVAASSDQMRRNDGGVAWGGACVRTRKSAHRGPRGRGTCRS